MCKVAGKLNDNFFDFAAERVWYIGRDVTKEIDKELDQLIEQVRSSLDPHLWNSYELKNSLFHDQTMVHAYKQGFIDALRLFMETKA